MNPAETNGNTNMNYECCIVCFLCILHYLGFLKKGSEKKTATSSVQLLRVTRFHLNLYISTYMNFKINQTHFYIK